LCSVLNDRFILAIGLSESVWDQAMAETGRVVKSIPWQMIVRLQGSTTLADFRMIIDRLEEFAALLSSQWSEFNLVTSTESADRES
jgi:hypothetical protein